MTTLYTVGHGDRDSGEFLEMLHHSRIETLVDVRAHPRSARHPQFDEDALRKRLGQAGMGYHWAGRQLGGFRQTRSDSRHPALPAGLQGYADYMETPAFQQAARQLVRLAEQSSVAVLCAEREPLHCHRSLIADYLVLRGVEVIHLMGPGITQSHLLRPEVRRESAALVYDRQTQNELPL